MHLARTSNSQEFIELKLESDLEAKIQFLSLFSQNMTTEVELRARLLQQPFLTPDIAMSVLNESLNFAIDGSIDRLVPFDILTDILEIIPRPDLDTLLDQLETAKVKFMKLSGPFEFIKENNLDSVHRQLALAYIDASKRLSNRQDEEILGRLAVFSFQIFPVNPKLVQSKANKVSKVRLESFDNESYKSLWTLLNYLHDPLELFSYDSKLKNYKLAGNDKEGVAFREVMNLADSVLSTFETIENSFNLASNNSDSDEKAVWREEFAAAENESEFHPLYLGAPNIFDYLLKSSGFRQQVLIQLGIFVHFLQYAQLGTLSKVQVHLDEKQKQWISQVVVKIKSRIEGTIQLSRNWKSFGLELLFRHELEWDKFKNTEFIDAKEPEDVEMKAEEPTAPKKASKMKFKKTGIERVFKDTPDFEELKQRAEKYV